MDRPLGAFAPQAGDETGSTPAFAEGNSSARKMCGIINFATIKSESEMSGFREPGFTDRQKAAQEARKNLLKKFREQPGPDDPEVARRRADREEIAAKRERQREERETARAEQKRREEEAAAAEAACIAREKEEEDARQAALLAEQKAKRDARYAARKARGKE